MSQIPPEDICEWLQCARFGELDSIKHILEEIYPSLKKELVFSTDVSLGNNTALHMAAANNHIEIAHTPEECLELLSRQNASGNTPLHWAVVNGHKDAASALLQKRPGNGDNAYLDTIINIKNEQGRTALDEAQMLGRDEISGLLLKLLN